MCDKIKSIKLKKKLTLPKGITLIRKLNILIFLNKKNKIKQTINNKVKLIYNKNSNEILLYSNYKSLINTYMTLIINNILGLILHYSSIISIKGIGYNIKIINNVLYLNIGYSHKIKISIDQDINIIPISDTSIYLSSINKAKLYLFTKYLCNLKKFNKYTKSGIIETQKSLGKSRIKNNYHND